MRKLKTLGKIGLALLVTSTIATCQSDIISISNDINVNPVKRYSNGKVLNLNRLEVDWSKNEKCKRLNPKYGYTTGNVVYDNI